MIAKGSKPVVRLVPIPQSGFKLGLLAGKVGDAAGLPRADAAEELDALGRR